MQLLQTFKAILCFTALTCLKCQHAFFFFTFVFFFCFYSYQRSLIHREAWFPSGPKIPQNPNCLINRKKSSKTQKLKNIQKYAKISNTPFDQRSLIHREAWFPPCLVRQNPLKKIFFFVWQFQIISQQKCSNLRPFLFIIFPQGF